MRQEAALYQEAQSQRVEALRPGPCQCGPCRLAAAPDRPLLSQEQVREVEQQQLSLAWACVCAAARELAGGCLGLGFGVTSLGEVWGASLAVCWTMLRLEVV